MLVTPNFRTPLADFFEVVSPGIFVGSLNFHIFIGNKYYDQPCFNPEEKTFFLRGETDITPYVQRIRESFSRMPAVLPYINKGRERLRARQLGGLSPYGVCDSVSQLLEYYDFEADPRKFSIAFTPVVKSQEPPRDGWRWHKWGPYIGTQTPRCEYIYDEPEINQVYLYHIYEILE